jgi:glycosyltransferase involved in cell wall biosynthesis
MPKVSICIPAWHQVELLKKNLQSITEQDFKDAEVIITDDSSDDSVEKLVNTFSASLPGLKYFRNRVPLGSPENWNESIRRSSSEYIKIMHHDDWFTEKDSLGKFVQLLDENPDSDFAFCKTKIIEEDTGRVRFNEPSAENLEKLKADPEIIYFWNFIGPPSSVIFRRASTEFFDRKIKYVVDMDFYIRMLKKNPVFIYTSDALITNTANDPKQVTAASLNAETQVREYIYLSNKLNVGKIPGRRYVSFLKSLFLKYGVKDFDWFYKREINLPRPTWLFGLLLFYLRSTGKFKS